MMSAMWVFYHIENARAIQGGRAARRLPRRARSRRERTCNRRDAKVQALVNRRRGGRAAVLCACGRAAWPTDGLTSQLQRRGPRRKMVTHSEGRNAADRVRCKRELDAATGAERIPVRRSHLFDLRDGRGHAIVTCDSHVSVADVELTVRTDDPYAVIRN